MDTAPAQAEDNAAESVVKEAAAENSTAETEGRYVYQPIKLVEVPPCSFTPATQQFITPDFDERFKPLAPMNPLQAATVEHEERLRRSKNETWAERDRAFQATQDLYTQRRKEVAQENRVTKKLVSDRKRVEAAEKARELEERLRVGRLMAGENAVEKIRRRMGVTREYD